MRGSHHPCAEFPGLYPTVPIMRGSHHPCAEILGLYACCAL
ncbi:unnamed protein product [Staurois parvus]|uniref:Uncharacterized protein n=1 Tax=Staurois parvus TaxID=386267 RepID=A0ABN9BIW4_9NEOB|nr:unnamed protein product [Staurois parvus]